MKPYQVSQYIIGKYYGYPDCCIKEFIKKPLGDRSLSKEQKQVHNNEGFIPCKQCADAIVDGHTTIDKLIEHRVCPTPYPDDAESKIKEPFIEEYKSRLHEIEKQLILV